MSDSMAAIQQTPAIRAKNIKISIAALDNVQKDDLHFVFEYLIKKYKRVPIDLMLDYSQMKIGGLK